MKTELNRSVSGKLPKCVEMPFVESNGKSEIICLVGDMESIWHIGGKVPQGSPYGKKLYESTVLSNDTVDVSFFCPC